MIEAPVKPGLPDTIFGDDEINAPGCYICGGAVHEWCASCEQDICKTHLRRICIASLLSRAFEVCHSGCRSGVPLCVQCFAERLVR